MIMKRVKSPPTPHVRDITSLMRDVSKESTKLVEEAFTFAQAAHRDHKRNSGDPYFIHLFETAKTLAELGMGPRTIAAGLLHDSIEDVGVKPETIKEKFGEEVLQLVEGVTKLGTLKYRGLKRHTESLRKLFVATSQDIRVVLIKLADRLHNMKTLEFVPLTKQKRIAQETLEVYVPVADRLGMGRLKHELEDLAFRFVQPEDYEEVNRLLKQKSKETMEHLEKVHKSLKKELAKQGIKHFTTEWRIKGLYSLYKKLQRKGGDIDRIHDISALRVIVPTIDDCYKVLGIIHNNWRPIPGEVKDYIAFEKPNGYQSIHTKILTGDGSVTEIQVRTKEMHHEAQFGIAAHLSYKQGILEKHINPNLVWIKSLLPAGMLKSNAKDKEKVLGERAPQWIKQIAEAQEDIQQSEEFLEHLKTDFFSHRIFVFTPQGDVVDLPIDSTPIDFAYAIHSDIGDHISGAKVNGKMTSLDTKLHNSDIVEILTKNSSHPTQKWLDMAKTTLARRRIKASLQKS